MELALQKFGQRIMARHPILLKFDKQSIPIFVDYILGFKNDISILQKLMRDFNNLDHESLLGKIPASFLYWDLAAVSGLANKKKWAKKISTSAIGRHSRGKDGKKNSWTSEGMVSEGFGMSDSEELFVQDLEGEEQTNEMFRKYWVRERKIKKRLEKKKKVFPKVKKGNFALKERFESDEDWDLGSEFNYFEAEDQKILWGVFRDGDNFLVSAQRPDAISDEIVQKYIEAIRLKTDFQYLPVSRKIDFVDTVYAKELAEQVGLKQAEILRKETQEINRFAQKIMQLQQVQVQTSEPKDSNQGPASDGIVSLADIESENLETFIPQDFDFGKLPTLMEANPTIGN